MTFDEYQKFAVSLARDKGHELAHRSAGLASEAGEVNGKIAKWIRDQKADPTKLDKAELAKELGDVLWYTAALAQHLGYALEEIAKQNVAKLSDRQKRGVLSGAGDNR